MAKLPGKVRSALEVESPTIVTSVTPGDPVLVAWQIFGEAVETVSGALYSWAPKSLQMVTAAMKSKDACSLEKSYNQPR